MTLSFLWFGAFAAAGGTSLVALTDFPAGWSPRGQTLFWGYASMAVFLVAILLSKVFYQLVEAFMWGVALLTLIGLLWAAPNAEALHALPDFIKTCLYRIDRCHGLIFLNHVYLPRHLLQPARPGRLNLIFLCISCVAYFLLAVGYLLTVTEIVQ